MFGASIAQAAGAAPAAPGGPLGQLGQFLPLILIFVVFYFLLIRPQQKKAREHQDFLTGLKKGDLVVSSGGLIGTVTGLTDTVVTLEVADGVRVKVSRPYILGTVNNTGKQQDSCPTKTGG
ncbi:MAG: preprotein translocase subunit YajC [Desulfobacteraceae bacterium]|nr:preprotein translocase subunit YajC [Desulfobacteraceae bacterium]